MDRLIKRFDTTNDNDLKLCLHRGIAYQKDMTVTVEYGKAYFEHYESYRDERAQKITAGRVEFVKRHHEGPLLDIGIGCGAFVTQHGNAHGFDVNPHAIQWLKDRNLYADQLQNYKALTFWDVIEHVKDPNSYFKRVQRDALVFVSIPIFKDLTKVRDSKHYKPGEHFYYFTESGFVEWMALYGFRLLERSDHETEAGRDSIVSFAFKRDLPGYRDFIGAYAEMHSTRHYGASASMYLPYVLPIVKELKPSSILDYGCGRSDLAAHFWRDGERTIGRYDPAIPEFKQMPEGKFGLVMCCDVMEHIPMAAVDRVLEQIREKSNKVFFCISTKPARAKLPNGQNAHVTLLKKSEWARWIAEVFGSATTINTEWDHVLMVRT